jgi:hypothetical protein
MSAVPEFTPGGSPVRATGGATTGSACAGITGCRRRLKI